PLWGTETRRHHLADSKFFECSCQRCADVTELGTMYSAVKCKKKNCKGYLLPETFMLPILQKMKNPDPENQNLDNKSWICSICKDEVHQPLQQLPAPLALLHDRREPRARADDRPGHGAGPGGGQRRQTPAEDSAVQEAGRLDRDISTRYMHLS
ncbi:Protein msta, partial [Operophtera brumata]